MRMLDETRLQVGDIILSTQERLASKVIRGATKSNISHAMLYVARGSAIDSTSEGVHAQSTGRMFFDASGAVHVRRLSSAPSEAKRALILEHARTHIGIRYSKSEAVRSAVGTARAPSRQQFCSRLVAQAYAHAGIRLVEVPDYFTPEELKSSPLLEPVPDALVEVSDEYVARVESDIDTNNVMRAGTNAVIAAARNLASGIASLGDIDAHLLEYPSDDERFARIFEESGYLTAWQAEYDKNRWQYELLLFVARRATWNDKRAYCLGVLADHGDLLARHDGNRAGYTILFGESGLQTFGKLKALYERLVDLQIERRAVALQWLDRFAHEYIPGPQDADLLVPHTEEWLAVLSRQNPQQAKLARVIREASGEPDGCTVCGDVPARNYKLANGVRQPDTVLTMRLCDDCRGIRKAMHGEVGI